MTKPYYTNGSISLYHGDALEVTEWLEADVLVTDPPYGLNAKLSAGKKGRAGPAGHARVHGDMPWDATLDVRDRALELWGPDKPAAVFASPKRWESPPFEPREVPLIWDKGELVGMGDLTFPWRVNYELVYTRGAFLGPRTSTAVLRYPLSNMDASRIGHPTPKPIPLMENIVTRAPKGTIADPFAGSGSTLIACLLLGIPAIGVEQGERFCEIAAHRLDQGVLDFGGVA